MIRGIPEVKREKNIKRLTHENKGRDNRKEDLV